MYASDQQGIAMEMFVQERCRIFSESNQVLLIDVTYFTGGLFPSLFLLLK